MDVIREIEANSQAVENYSRQIHCLVIEKWKRWKFIDDVVIPEWPYQWCEMEHTRKRLTSRACFGPSESVNVDLQHSRFSSGSSDANAEQIYPLDSERPNDTSDELIFQQLDIILKEAVVKLQNAYMKGQWLKQERNSTQDPFGDKLEDVEREKILDEKGLLNAASTVLSLFRKENSRLGSVLHQIILNLEQVALIDDRLPTGVSDLLSRVKNLTHEALLQQQRDLDACIRKVEENLVSNRKTAVNVDCDADERLFNVEDFRGQWNELQILNDQLPGHFREISDLMDSFVNGLLESACDVAVDLRESDLEEKDKTNPKAEDPNRTSIRAINQNSTISPSEDFMQESRFLLTSPNGNLSVSVDKLGVGLTKMFGAMDDLVKRVDLIVTSMNSSSKDFRVSRGETNQVPVEKYLSDVKHEVAAMINTVNTRLTSMDEKLKLLDESNTHLRTDHLNMQEKIEMFLEHQMPTLLNNQTAVIQQFLLQHLSAASQGLEDKKTQQHYTSAVKEVQIDWKNEESIQNTMLVVGNVVQETVQAVADQIKGMLTGDIGNSRMDEASSPLDHHPAAYVPDCIGKTFASNSSDEQKLQDTLFASLADDTVKEIIEKSLAAYTSTLYHKLRSERDSEDSIKSRLFLPLGNVSIDSTSGRSMQYSHRNVLDIVSSESFEELISGASELLQFLGESVYSSLVSSICKDGPLALLLRKYVAYLGHEKQESQQTVKNSSAPLDAGISQNDGSSKNYFAALKRVLTPRTRNQLSILEASGELLLNQLGDRYVQSIVKTLCDWSKRNFLASAFCMQLGQDIADDLPSMQPVLSARTLADLVQLGFEAEHLLSGIGEGYVNSLSNAIVEGSCNRNAFSLLVSSLRDAANFPHSQKDALMGFLSTRSVEKLESLMSEARTLLSRIDNSSHDVIGILRATASENLVAAAIYHEVTSNPNHHQSRILDTSTVVTQTRRLLERLLEQSAELLGLLREKHGDDILSLILNSSAVQSPLAAVLYRELCNISQNGPKDPSALRRVLSAKTKRNLDQILAEGRLLLSKLGNEHLDAVLGELHYNGRESLLGSILLYEIVNAPVPPFSTDSLEEGLSAQCKSSIEQLLVEGQTLLININDKYAEGILDSVVQNTVRSPIARILGFEILSSKHAKDLRKSKRSLSAQSRCSLQFLLREGRTLITSLSGQNSGELLLSICENVHRNTLASVLYFELVAHWLVSEGSSNQSIERKSQAVNTYVHTLLINILKEGRILLSQLDSNRFWDIISSLYDNRSHNPVSAVILHKIFRSLRSCEQIQNISSATTKGQEIIEDLLKEGQELIERIGNGHAENILAIIRSQVKPSPLSALIYNQLLSSFIANNTFESLSDYLSFDSNFFECLDAQFCGKVIELVDEGQKMFDSLGDIYSKSLMDLVVMSAGENPIAALLYSDNLLSLGKGLISNTSKPEMLDTIKSALSARSLKNYEDVLHEGGKLLETIDVGYADTIIDSISSKETPLSAGIIQEMLHFIADDKMSDSDEERVVSDLSEQFTTVETNSAPAVANVRTVDSEAVAAEILQRAFRMHSCKRILKQKRVEYFARRLQCAVRYFIARKCYRYRKQFSDFIHYPFARLQAANNLLSTVTSNHFVSISMPKFKASNRSRVKPKLLEKQIAISNNKDSRLEILCAKNTIRWSRKRLKAIKKELALELLYQAQAMTALRFSNLSLVYCIARLRKGITQKPSKRARIHSDEQSSNIYIPKYKFASRKIMSCTILIQQAFRNYKCREIFGTLFVRRENIEIARFKISKWIMMCRALRKLRGERKRRIQMQSEMQSASRVQRMFRVHLARLEVSYLKRYLRQRKATPLPNTAHLSISASYLQKVWRGHSGRQIFLGKVSSRQEQERNARMIQSLIKIQCALRNHAARHLFARLNERFCNEFFTSSANMIRSAFICHTARLKVIKLRKSLNLLQQYSTKLAWLRTIEDLVRVSALEWKETCLRAEKIVGDPKMSFTYAQSLAPAVFPTWWLSHFPVSLSSRVDLKAEIFCNLEEQIRIDRTNALGGASSFLRTVNMIGSLVNELTESHLIALGMSESYNVLISLMAFCNIHGSRLISSVDESSQKAGNDLLMYALMLADGPCLNIPGLSERLEYRRWTQSNLCRMYYLRSNFEKTAQCARFLISPESSSGDNESTGPDLQSTFGRMYLGAAQSKLGKHVTAVATFQQAIDSLAKLSSKVTENNWKSFCCTKEPDRFYLCSVAHLAAVCFYNISVEFVACGQLNNSRLAIHRAHTLAQKESIREPVFYRRVKLTLVAIETLTQRFTPAPASTDENRSISTSSRASSPMKSDFTTEQNYSKLQTPTDSRNNDRKSNVRSELSKKRFGAWFPPSVAFRNTVSAIDPRDKGSFLGNEVKSMDSSLFLKLDISGFKTLEVALQRQSPRRLSPLRKETAPGYHDDLQSLLVLLAIPLESKDVFEILHNESENLYKAAFLNSINDSLHIFTREFREISRNFADQTLSHSGKLLSRMIDLASLSIQLIIRNMFMFEKGSPVAEISLKSLEKYLSIALSLLFGPLTKDISVKVSDLRTLALSCRAILFLLKNDIPKANWVLSDVLSGLKLNLSQKQRAVLWLNHGVCLSLLGQHKESFDASYSAWKILLSCKSSEPWFCYSPSHHEKELTIHEWSVFAAHCKFQLAQESFLLGFEGPCLRFAKESRKILALATSDEQKTDCNLFNSIFALIRCASSLHLVASKGDSQALLDSKLSRFKKHNTICKLEEPVKYAWPPSQSESKADLEVPQLPRISFSRLSRASEPTWSQRF